MPIPLAGPIITAAIAALSRLASTRIGMWVLSGLAFLGLEIAVLGTVANPLMDNASSHFAGLPGDIIQWMGVLQIDTYLTVVFSAYAVAAGKRAFLRKRAAPAS